MTTNETILNEASRKLTAYINTGITGFFTQATDRLEAAGVKCRHFAPSKIVAKDLVDFIHAHYTVK